MTKVVGVLTSGGDSPGMNAAVRAVVRTLLDRGADVYGVYEGYRGMVAGGHYIKKLDWDSVSGILQRGGTVLGTARCDEFREREGRLKAVKHLLKHNINRLVVIGGDGSLTGAHVLRSEWAGLIQELVEKNEISQELAAVHPHLMIAGLVGSIDNDMYGTDMTIGADTALHRIISAIDAIFSTAASHQRTFIIEVMGRNCGYLALMSSLATGAEWVFIPENPPDVDDWENKMCEVLQSGRKQGRRASIVIIAEGARDRKGNPIKSDDVKKVLEERLGETRVTILGHVQRGGAPSAFDRNLSTILGYAATHEILDATPESESYVIGMRGNRPHREPLMYCVEQTRAVAQAIKNHEYERAMELRGRGFMEAYWTFRTLVRSRPHKPDPEQKRHRFGIMTAGGPAAGMNMAVRAATRLAMDKGHTVLSIKQGFEGLIDNEIEELEWMSVSGWAPEGGSNLGTNRLIPQNKHLYTIARTLEEHQIDGLLMIGGWEGYQGIYKLCHERENFEAFNIPMICLPASISNNLPGSELSLGADTALNNIAEAVDKIKQSGAASNRCFVVEVMGQYCGYLALMSGLATGAERVYLHEEGVTLVDLLQDLAHLARGFKQGKGVGLIIRNEMANELYTTSFISALFEQEGGDLFDVRQAILGHLQQGGNPTPFDRIQATRMATRCIEHLIEEVGKKSPQSSFAGYQKGELKFFDIEDLPRMVDKECHRPKDQWWMQIGDIARVMAKSSP